MGKNWSVSEMESSDLQADEVTLFERVQKYLSLERGATVPTELARAWEQFFGVVNTEIRRSAGLIQPSRAHCEDSIQDVWIAILIQIPRFRNRLERGKPLAWLRVLIRRVLLRCRRRSTHLQTTPLPDQQELNLQGRESDPAEAYERERDRRLMVAGLRELRECAPRLSYLALFLHEIEDLSTEQVAARLELTSKQVRRRLGRMHAKLRRILVRLRAC